MSNVTLVKSLLSRPIAFHRSLVPVAGNVAGAVWLGQLLYWSDGRGKDPNGWIYKTQDEWEEETGLSADQQRNVRELLRKQGVIEEKKKGIPCRIFYRVKLENLASLLAKLAAEEEANKILLLATSSNVETPHLDNGEGNNKTGESSTSGSGEAPQLDEVKSNGKMSGKALSNTEITAEITAETTSEITAEITAENTGKEKKETLASGELKEKRKNQIALAKAAARGELKKLGVPSFIN